MFIYFRKRKAIFYSGYTLIELLIGIAILMLVTGAGIASFTKLNERETVEGAAKLVELAIRDAQKQAVARVKPPGFCIGSNTLVAYRVSLGTVDINKYQITAVCSDASIWSEGLVTLPSGPVFMTINTIDFNLLGEADGNYDVRVGNSEGTILYNIGVDVGGSISFLRIN